MRNSATTVATEIRNARRTNEEPVPKTYNPKQERMIQKIVWFEDSPQTRALSSTQPRGAGLSKSSSIRCPPQGCWPLLHLNLGSHGLNPGLHRLNSGINPGLQGLVSQPWGFKSTTAMPVPTTSTSTLPNKVYVRL